MMKWKLRIPMIIFVCGVLSGVFQYWQPVITVGNYILDSLFFIVPVGIIIYILEKTEVNDKKVPAMIGILLIVSGFLADYLTAG